MTDLRGYGCTDHGCVFGHPGGMGTNGGCKCLDKYEVRDNPEALRRIRVGVRALRAERDALRAELDRSEIKILAEARDLIRINEDGHTIDLDVWDRRVWDLVQTIPGLVSEISRLRNRGVESPRG